MLTAKEAKKVSQKAADTRVPDLLNQILKFVNECAEKGHTCCNFLLVAEPSLFIVQELIRRLKKLGYKAKFNTHFCLSRATIDIDW